MYKIYSLTKFPHFSHTLSPATGNYHSTRSFYEFYLKKKKKIPHVNDSMQYLSFSIFAQVLMVM